MGFYIIMIRSYRFSYNGKEMTVICHQGESLDKCYEDLKKRFIGIKIIPNEITDKKAPI